MRSLTKEVITLFYRHSDEHDSEKNEQFDLEKNKVQSKRKNFEKFFEANYKQFFYCIDRQKNNLIASQARDRILKLFSKGSDIGDISEADWKDKAQEIFDLYGMKWDPKESKNKWRDLLKYFNGK